MTIRTFKLLIAFIITSVTHNSAAAQKGILFSTETRLSSCLVHQVYQGGKGIIWISTENGLNRYDGYNFQTYTTADGLCNDNVNCVMHDSKGNLYIGTISGLCVYKNNRIEKVMRTQEDEAFNAFTQCFCMAPDGSLLLGTSGRGIWKVEDNGTVTRIYSNIAELAFALKMAYDKKGVLWVLTNNQGVQAIKNGKATAYPLKESTNYGDIVCDSRNNVYVGFINGGVYRMGAARKGFELIPSTANLSVTSLMTEQDNRLLVGTNGTGLKYLDTATGALTDSRLYSNDVDMSRTKVYSMVKDKMGNLWLGLMQKGVFMQPPASGAIHYIGRNSGTLNSIGEAYVQNVFMQRDGTLWVASDQDGLYALTPRGELIRHYVPNMSDPSSVPNTVLTMTEDNDGRLWIGSFTQGCGWFDAATGVYHRSKEVDTITQSVFDLRMGKDNDMWIGTLGGGLLRLNLTTGRMTRYTSRYDNPDDKNHLANDFVVQIELSPDGKLLFVGTATGLSCLDIAGNRWDNVFGTNQLLDGEAIRAIRYRKDMGLWVGTSKGLYNIEFAPPYNGSAPKIKHYTTANGLPTNHVASIEFDNKGLVWVSTSGGLSQLNPKNARFTHFYDSDGLHGNEYSEGASFHDKAGNLYFAGSMGVSYFAPARMEQKSKHIELILSQMLVGGELIKAGEKSGRFEICDTAVMAAKRFDFCSEDNTLTLRFSTLTYSGLKHITFRYSINGERWKTLQPGENDLTLSRMPPGDYALRVQALYDGVPTATKEFLIVIHNPWYFTPVARTIYMLIIIAAILLYLRAVNKRSKEKLKLQKHIHAEELNEQKLQSFINLSHEIRTPMTLIMAPLLQLINEDNDSHRKATYDIIKRNAERIMHLVDQIMDIRKIDKGHMTMHMCETDMVEFVDDVVGMFRIQAGTKQITMGFDHGKARHMALWIDRMQFAKVLNNLLSNAVKNTPAGGEITVTVTTDGTAQEGMAEGTLTLTVFNSGSSIPPESLPHIFERFYQAPAKTFKYKSGTGVGLDLTRSIVLLHHGTITARNEQTGVTFTVTLPLGKEHLKPEEIAPWTEEEQATETQGQKPQEKETAKKMAAEIFMTPAMTGDKGNRATIVIAEDDDEIRNYLKDELSATYRVLTFPNGDTALTATLREVPQLVISDVMMPDMDGHALCTNIKKNVTTNHIPVILITAKTRDEDKLEGLETGADLYVTKPFNLDILKRNIANLIASRKVMQNKFTGKEDGAEQLDDIEVESEDTDEKLLSRILAVINDNIYNSDLNIDMICKEVGISRVHLHRKMKEMTNQSPHDFIRNVRLKQAAKMLCKKGTTVTEVAYRCGFNSSTSFSTMFKNMYGVSPRNYKLEHEEK